MRILAVGAHPDDIEFLCAGTLMKFRSRGDEIFTAVLCNGDKGHYEIGPEELACIRRLEAEEAAKSEGATLVSFGLFPDLEVYADSQSRRKVVEIVRQAKPDLILTHYPDDYMCDHSTTGRLVIDASFVASLPNYRTESPHTKSIPLIYFMDAMAAVNFQPTDYVDISELINEKGKALRCHQSQYRWLLDHDGIDYIDFMKQHSAFRGVQCGVKYAEAFQRYAVWGRIKPGCSLP
ncbi:MAG: PIG-L family deacetylase [Candidatus Omnitrophica bacterium]|nr:PIG-L family deacetylase [Candidatus Omnitrophota bacterium]